VWQSLFGFLDCEAAAETYKILCGRGSVLKVPQKEEVTVRNWE
jgi:hypothetical protein